MWHLRNTKTLAWCCNCKRIEFLYFAGPFFWRCSECGLLQPKELS